MACFIVPAAEAVVTAVASKAVKSNEVESVKIPFSTKLGWLTKLLSGGAVLLAFEHVWHGEVTPWFPFLTAAANSADAAEMIHEMATTGVGMALAVTLAWSGMLLVAHKIEKETQKEATEV